MKILFLSLILFFSTSSFADSVKVEINPPKPVAGEVFYAYFRIFTESSEVPDINFNPYKVEVVEKANQGVTTRYTFANGVATTVREITVVYNLVANSTGLAGLRDINVNVGGKIIRHPSMNFEVVKEAQAAADVFVMADVPKKSIFLGEGVIVRYYLYSKAPFANNPETKKYPKLDNFLKRFLQEPDRGERVSVNGEIYSRNQLYAAKLFPEKIGILKIDPLAVSVSIMLSRSGDPFGNLGFGREVRTKNISSETVKIEVKPLPEENKPTHFTGLVGKHDFDLQMANTKLIVNEPLELKLTVSGVGALENLEAPTILKNPALEEFESNGDLKITDADQAVKVFDYTFLAKESLKLPSSTLTLSYFDPDSMKYVPVQLPVPELVVVGGGQRSLSKDEDEKKEAPSQAKDTTATIQKKTLELTNPLMNAVQSWKSWIPYFNFILAFFAIGIAVGMVIKRDSLPKFATSSIPSAFKKGQFNLSDFTRWLSPLIQKTGKSPLAIIRESSLSEVSKTYFIDLLNSNDYKDYASNKSEMKFTYKSSSFKELDKYIERNLNENNPQSS